MLMCVFSLSFSMAAFWNKITVPAQPCSLALIREQNAVLDKKKFKNHMILLHVLLVLMKCCRSLLMFPVRIMCMRVDSCSVAQIEASTESNRPFLRDPLLTV